MVVLKDSGSEPNSGILCYVLGLDTDRDFNSVFHKWLPTVPEEAAEPGKVGVQQNSNTRAVRGLIKAAVDRG